MSSYSTLVLENQFGEKSNNFVLGGSSQISLDFIVDNTNGNGLGQRSLKAPASVSNVFMHTTATPLGGNPNPEAGYILVEFSSPFPGYLGGTIGFVSPASGTPINVTTGVTAGLAYIITSLGTTTETQWQSLGLPLGVIPAVGVSFVAPATATATGTGVIEVPSHSGVLSAEVVGNSNLNVSLTSSYVLVQCLNGSSALTAPANGTVVAMTFNMAEPPAPLI